MGKAIEREHGEPEDLITKMVERMGIWHLSVGQAVRMRINTMTEEEAAEVREAAERVDLASGAELQRYFQLLERIDESHIEQQAENAQDLGHDIVSMLLEHAREGSPPDEPGTTEWYVDTMTDSPLFRTSLRHGLMQVTDRETCERILQQMERLEPEEAARLQEAIDAEARGQSHLISQALGAIGIEVMNQLGEPTE